MTSAETLIRLIELPADSDAVRELIAADGLTSSADMEYDGEESQTTCLSAPGLGFDLMIRDGRVNTVHLSFVSFGNRAVFAGTLPSGLSANSTRSDVAAVLGTPVRCGENRSHPMKASHAVWDRFDRYGVRLTFRYVRRSEQLTSIVISSADPAVYDE